MGYTQEGRKVINIYKNKIINNYKIDVHWENIIKLINK